MYCTINFGGASEISAMYGLKNLFSDKKPATQTGIQMRTV
jgi:hypothetical protein